MTRFHPPFNLSWLLLACLFLSFGLISAVHPSTSNPECPYEPLPFSLDALDGLAVNGEVHLHNKFFTDFDRGKNHTITFNLNETSDIRVYVEPHYFDIDIWIYQADKTSVAHTSDYSLADEVVFATLPPGSYYIRYYFFGSFVGTCPTMTTEISIIPTSRLAQRLNSYQCPPSQVLPALDFSSLATSSASNYVYNVTDAGLNVQNPINNTKYVFITSYPLSLPPGDSYGQVWEIEAILGFHFPTATLGLLVQEANLTDPTNLTCYDVGNCSIAYHNARGQSTLKALLAPGEYKLFIYDVPGERNATACSPFSMSLSVSLASPEEDFLNCAGEPFPTTLYMPGMLEHDDSGYMYYREDIVLDLSVPSSSFWFLVEEDSYFRAFTVAHRVDIDIQLRNMSDNTILAYGLKMGSVEEAIQYYLTPGNYTFSFILFGQYADVFCDTVMTEIAIAPASLYSGIDLCTGQPVSTPDLSGLANFTANSSYSLPYSVYRYNYSTGYAQKVILSQTFNVSTNTYIQAELGSNFLLGDIRIWLLKGLSAIDLGYHRRNMHYLDTIVPPGQYTIQIVTGDAQQGIITNFPPCATYSLSLRVKQANTTGSEQCLRSRHIPYSLNTPENLNTSPKIHIQEAFLIPTLTGIYVKEKIVFTVNTTSYFRMYTEPHHIDIDLQLEANGNPVVKAINFNVEEAISWLVVPGINYTVTVTFYKWNFIDHGNDPCYTYLAELAITPYVNTTQDPCPPNKLPQSDVGPVYGTPMNFDDVFFFSQGSTRHDFNISFSIPAGSSAMFRAQVMYDFVWNDLALRLDLPNTQNDLQGELMYNKNEIPAVELGPGVYTLHIYEPFNETMNWRTNNNNMSFTLRQCVLFRLRFSVEVISDDIDPLLLSCPDLSLTPSWDGPGFLSALSGNNMIFDRYVLANVLAKEDSVVFTITTPSIFRMYIPVQTSLDVDVTLYKGYKTTPIANPMAYGSEEALEILLQPDVYRIKFHYWGIMTINLLPPPSACASFKLEISIFNYTAAAALPFANATCSTSFPLSIAPTNGNYTLLNFTRQLTDTFIPFALFTITEVHRFTVHFDQVDPVGGVAMLLKSLNFTRTYNPLYFANQIYLNEYLPAGTYNLSFHDPTGAEPFKCAPYTLWYNLTASPVPNEICYYHPLPSDLSSASGGSLPYGGPQASDGSIHLVGESFNILEDKLNRDNYFAFATVGTSMSYLRIFVDVDAGNTILAYLFATQASGPMGALTAMNGNAASTVWTLPGNSTYKLQLQFTKAITSLFCNYFTFEFVLMPESKVIAALSCPANLPSETNQLPPEIVNMQPHADYSFSSNRLVVSSAKFLSTKNRDFRYTIKINTGNSTSLTALIDYNFVVNDFYVYLESSTGQLLTRGVHQQSIATDSNFNFVNYLQYDLAPGSYSLTIVDATPNNFNMTTFCHFFGFSLTLAVTGGDDIPRILQIQPGSSGDLDPTVPLVLTIVFSEATFVPLPKDYYLPSYIQSENIIYLKANDSSALSPSSAFFDSSNTQLTVRFLPPFTKSGYTLVVNTSYFMSVASGVAFSAGVFATRMPSYYMRQNCTTCSGHGQCNSLGVCECVAPWIGMQCDRCALGYHADASGTSCVANTYCNASSCNGHGSCYDYAGDVKCFCATGYAGDACDRCDVEYSGYPNCTGNPDSDDDTEGEACTAPLLPNNLNTPAYLGYTGHVHMQGFYYISLDLKIHEIRFNITETSVFRIYTEPHDVDVDIWLFEVNDDGSQTVVAYEISFGTEETLFLTLPAGPYLIRLRYYAWIIPKSSCQVFDLELAIAPLTNVTAEANSMKYYCGAQNNLPSIPALNLSAPYDFSGKGFAVNAPTTNSTAANYFYSINITINPPSPTSIASLHATVGYRFLQGDISIMLEAGTQGNKCFSPSFSLAPLPGCVYGDNIANENTLHRYLEAGDYILWIYEPIGQNNSISACSPFDFSLHVEFVDDEEDIFNCDLPPIPLSLDNSEYEETPGNIHFHDYFVLDGRTMNFTVYVPSYLRVAVAGNDVVVKLNDYNNTAYKPKLQLPGQDQNILYTLNPGVYYLSFRADLFAFCPVLDIEFALAPTTVSLPSCPADASRNPPSIDFTKLPVVFAPTRNAPAVPTFYTFNTQSTPVVARFTFRTAAAAYLDVAVESNFLFGGLRIQLLSDAFSSADPVFGRQHYNLNRLQQELPAGSYELRILLPVQSIFSTSTCTPYNLRLYLTPTTGSSASPVCYGEHLPYSFNTLHYLGSEGQMNYQTSDWLIPPNFAFATLHDIKFSVNTTSLIRVYTEPHSIDIDIKLYDANGPKLLASGSNKISTEESFTYILAANTSYYLELQFYNFLTSPVPDPCSTFNMQVAIAPNPARPQTCPGNTNSWPQLPSPIPVPFTYNSIDNNVKLYYQQAASITMNFSTILAVTEPANVYIDLGYDFLVGDLVVGLFSQTTKNVYIGSNRLNRNTLDLMNLPADNYTLRFYEPSPNVPTAIGCSEFTFAIYVEAYSAYISEEKYIVEYHFPKTLDAIPYLNASSKVHLANNYFMFDGSGLHENTTFTLKEVSLVHARSYLADTPSGRSDPPQLTLFSATNQTAYKGLMRTVLQPGTYTLKISPPPFVEEGGLGTIVSVELAIDTLNDINFLISASPETSACVSTPFSAAETDPNGYYQDGADYATIDSRALQETDVFAQIPFKLDRYSLVYAQVGSMFIITELELIIISANYTVYVHGRMRKNINEIHQVLPPGDYTLIITQTLDQSNSGIPEHCGIFSYSIIIKDALNPGVIVDCSTMNQVPWQLDSRAGTVPYGGPITNGSLHLYGTSMHIPASQAGSPINFTLSAPTLMSVLVLDYVSTFTIDFTITSNSTGVQLPKQNVVTTGPNSRISQYALNASSYLLAINYHPSSLVLGGCYSYTLQIDLAPTADLLNEYVCTNLVAQPLPAILPLDANGAGYDLINSFINGSQISGMGRQIKFTTVMGSTAVVFSFGYNSLVSTFAIRLARTDGNTSTLVMQGRTKGQQVQSGETTVYQYLATRVPAGNYTLRITHPEVATPFASPQMCIPFIFSYEIGNISALAITDVDPPGSRFLSITDPFTITVTFSAPPYNASGVILSAYDAGQILDAFYLTLADGVPVHPFNVKPSLDRLKWTLYFTPLGTAGRTYTLAIQTNSLFDRTGTPLSIPNLYQYSTGDCGSHGTATNGKCICATGYAGAFCSSCDVTKNYVSASDSPSVCVVNQCKSDTCGCMDQPTCATPLGTCSTNSSGLARCACSALYKGDHCESCLPGLINYPACSSSAEACKNYDCKGHGSCMTNNSGPYCQCLSNFQGDHCDACNTGYENYPTCSLIDPCKSFACNAGTCTKNNSGLPVCQCPINFAGDHCDQCAPGYLNYPTCSLPVDPCSSYTCTFHGSCTVDKSNNPHCECQPNYDGDHCDTCKIGYQSYPDCTPISPCATFTCNQGTCAVNATGLPHCSCHPQFAGEHCEMCAPGFINYPTCAPVPDPCASYSCSGHGTCSVDAKNNPSCSCFSGFDGDHCDTCKQGYINYPNCALPDGPCATFSCNNAGTCAINGTGLPHCTCYANYAGEHCEVCKPGYLNYPTCSAGPCPSECKNGGTCAAGVCKCVNHWTGNACEICPSQFAGSKCDHCASGYTGDNCDSKSEGGKKGMSGVKVFFTVIGVLAGIALLGVGGFFGYKRYKQRRGQRYSPLSQLLLQDETKFQIEDDNEL